MHHNVDAKRRYADIDTQITLAIALAHGNVEHAPGGPFGAAIFDAAGRVVSVGVNRVQPMASSLAHAEIVALVNAQRKLGRARINGDGALYTLATSAQPCCQCHGAILWAGIDTLVIAARANDIESLTGFDERPSPAHRIDELQHRGIRGIRDLRRHEARAALRASAVAGGGVNY